MNLREEMRQEALGRMVELELHPKSIYPFKNHQMPALSYQGSLTELNEVEAEKVRRFEEQTGFLVYHTIRTDTEIGVLLTLLYVSNVPEEWEMERKDTSVGYPYAYVVNMDDDIYSEFGVVGIQKHVGCLVRTA